MMCAISAAYFSGWAAGRSILLSTGMIVRSFSSARYRLARVCASMPWAASTTRMVPSHAARERDTSYVKSTWPGVSIMLRMCVVPESGPVFGAHGRRTACDLMVMPRSRSMSMRSRYWARICRGSTTPVICSIRSASVDLPWSMWAMMQKLRISAGSVRLGSGTLLGVAGTLVRFSVGPGPGVSGSSLTGFPGTGQSRPIEIVPPILPRAGASLPFGHRPVPPPASPEALPGLPFPVVRAAGWPPVILESALLDVLPGREEEFLAAFAEARPLIAVQRGFRSLALRRCLDEGRGSRFLLQVEWETLTDHTEGFRGSPEYQRWRALLHHYYQPFPQVEHYGEALLGA